MNPKSAWANGNYANYLLYTRRDFDESIKYGERALALMNYPAARENLALAYFMRATERYESGDGTGAYVDFQRARSMGLDGQAAMAFCKTGCKNLQQMLGEFGAEIL